MKNRIVVIGSGNVAEAMCRWIPATGHGIVQLFARNTARGNHISGITGIPFESDPAKIAKADIYIISVSDKAIGEVSAIFDAGDAIVVHTSGNCPVSELSDSIKNRGVLYPLQTFTAGRELDYKEIPLFIEAENDNAYERIKALAGTMSDNVHDSDLSSRRKLHVAAVFVCNFVNHMYCLGYDFMEHHGLDTDTLKPLIRETTQKMLATGTPCEVQTGPAVREDYPTIGKHLETLNDNTELANIYKILTESIIIKKWGILKKILRK